MEENRYVFPSLIGIKYVLRSTGEEVEIVVINQPENGARSLDDWVTYIDSKGNEHIKERLNFQLDFKQVNDMMDTWNKRFGDLCLPSTENQRAFEVAKEIIGHRQYLNKEDLIKEAVEIGWKVAEAFKD